MVAARSAINTCSATAMPARPAAAAFDHGLGPDGRHIDAFLLPGLGRLDQHPGTSAPARPACFAQFGAAGEHRIGAFGGFHGKDVTLYHHRGLAHVEAAERPHHIERHIDIGLLLGGGRLGAEPANARHDLRRHVGRPMHPIALVLEETHDPRQHVVVAAFAEAEQERQGLQCAEIEPHVGEIRAVHAANDHQILAAVAVERGEHLADLAPLDPGMRKALDLVAGLAANGDDMQGPPPRRR